MEKLNELMKKDKWPIQMTKEMKLQKLQEKTKLVNEVVDAVQRSDSIEENKLINLVELLEH